MYIYTCKRKKKTRTYVYALVQQLCITCCSATTCCKHHLLLLWPSKVFPDDEIKQVFFDDNAPWRWRSMNNNYFIDE